MAYNAVVLSGLPASGKTTLVRKLSAVYNWPSHAIGDLFRERWRAKHPSGEVSFEDYWRSVPFEEQMSVNNEMEEIVRKGNIVGDSRYTSYLTGLSREV